MSECGSDAPEATVLITTKNRKDDLRRALVSACGQDVCPEVIVISDGSDDGTPQMVKREFPEVILHEHRSSAGLIRRRNEGTAAARGRYVFSIDDDAEFTSPSVVRQTLADFADMRVKAVAVPFVNVEQGPDEFQRAPAREGVYLTHSYRGTAYAVCRETFLRLGGYKDFFIHQGEEGDFCLRLLDAGHFVRLGRADPIHHFESPKRDWRRMDYYGRRNDVLTALLDYPFPEVFLYTAGTIMKGAAFGFRVGRPKPMLSGIFGGLRDGWRLRQHRDPVSRETLQRYRRLRKEGATLLEPS